MKGHIKQCGISLGDEDIKVLGYNTREDHLHTLEAIIQHEFCPTINGKYEHKSKTLSMMIC